jgi:hypothetical protein
LTTLVPITRCAVYCWSANYILRYTCKKKYLSSFYVGLHIYYHEYE